MRDVLVFWFHAPPKVEKGAFNYVSRNWGNRVLYLCRRDFSAERKGLNWNDNDYGEAELRIFNDENNIANEIKTIIEELPNAIHVFAGFFNPFLRLFMSIAPKQALSRVVIFTERPKINESNLRGCIKKIGIPIYHRILHLQFRSKIKVLLPLGMSGITRYAGFGWQADKMYPFMYCPNVKRYTTISRISDPNNLRLIYIGRFNFITRGLDILMKAMDNLTINNWSLDLVGGHGENADEVINWSKKKKNVSYLGKWPSESVVERLRDYDIAIVPSKTDGWNLIVNEALNAGVGVITSDESVSHELIVESKAGICFKANNVKELTLAISEALLQPSIVDDWKAKAINYSYRISPEVVGKYFISILDYEIYRIGAKPKCPWYSQDVK